MKLSPAQEEVLNLMANGWELGQSTTYDGRSWLQQGGVGKGGKSKTISANTIHALFKRKLIHSKKYRFPHRTYTLTELGRDTVKK